MVVEPFIDGVEYNVVAFSPDASEATIFIAERKRLSPTIPVAVEHTASLQRDDGGLATLREAMSHVFKAVCPSGGIAFAQFILGDSSRPELIDLGVRLPGGMMDVVVERSIGADVAGIELRRVLKMEPAVEWRGTKVTEVACRFALGPPRGLPIGPIPDGLDRRAADELNDLKVSAFRYSASKEVRPVRVGNDRVWACLAKDDVSGRSLHERLDDAEVVLANLHRRFVRNLLHDRLLGEE